MVYVGGEVFLPLSFQGELPRLGLFLLGGNAQSGLQGLRVSRGRARDGGG